MTLRPLLAAFCALSLAACEREDRNSRSTPVDMKNPPHTREPAMPVGSASEELGEPGTHPFERNAYQLAQGKLLFKWMNCVGCHGNGGGGSGPALMDEKWRYGADIANIAETIRNGRPNGMPSFANKVTDQQIWQLAAYVRSMIGAAPKPAAPARSDDAMPRPSEGRLPEGGK